MARIIHLVSFVLAWLCATGLISGMIFEARTHEVFFESYIGTFWTYGIIFGFIAYKTRRPVRTQPPAQNPDDHP